MRAAVSRGSRGPSACVLARSRPGRRRPSARRSGPAHPTWFGCGEIRTCASHDRAKAFGEKGVHYVDVGTSGGVLGLERGFCLMIGGAEVVARLDPLFATIAPGVDGAARTPGTATPRAH